MSKEGCEYSQFCLTDGCALKYQVEHQAEGGGIASPGERLKSVQEQGRYWDERSWYRFIHSMRKTAKLKNCQDQTGVEEVIQEETQTKIDNNQLLPSPPQNLIG